MTDLIAPATISHPREWPTLIQRTTAVAAIAAGLVRLLMWPLQFATPSLIFSLGLSAWSALTNAVFWLMVLAGTVAVGGLVTGWIVDRWSRRRGVVLIAGGIAVALLWWLIGSRLPLVNFSGIDITTDPWQDAIARPMLIRAVLIMASVDIVAVGLLMVGGIRMLRQPATTP